MGKSAVGRLAQRLFYDGDGDRYEDEARWRLKRYVSFRTDCSACDYAAISEFTATSLSGRGYSLTEIAEISFRDAFALLMADKWIHPGGVEFEKFELREQLNELAWHLERRSAINEETDDSVQECRPFLDRVRSKIPDELFAKIADAIAAATSREGIEEYSGEGFGTPDFKEWLERNGREFKRRANLIYGVAEELLKPSALSSPPQPQIPECRSLVNLKMVQDVIGVTSKTISNRFGELANSDNPPPTPAVPKSGSIGALYDWADLRPWLVKVFPRREAAIPELFPSPIHAQY